MRRDTSGVWSDIALPDGELIGGVNDVLPAAGGVQAANSCSSAATKSFRSAVTAMSGLTVGLFSSAGSMST